MCIRDRAGCGPRAASDVHVVKWWEVSEETSWRRREKKASRWCVPKREMYKQRKTCARMTVLIAWLWRIISKIITAKRNMGLLKRVDCLLWQIFKGVLTAAWPIWIMLLPCKVVETPAVIRWHKISDFSRDWFVSSQSKDKLWFLVAGLQLKWPWKKRCMRYSRH